MIEGTAYEVAARSYPMFPEWTLELLSLVLQDQEHIDIAVFVCVSPCFRSVHKHAHNGSGPLPDEGLPVFVQPDSLFGMKRQHLFVPRCSKSVCVVTVAGSFDHLDEYHNAAIRS